MQETSSIRSVHLTELGSREVLVHRILCRSGISWGDEFRTIYASVNGGKEGEVASSCKELRTAVASGGRIQTSRPGADESDVVITDVSNWLSASSTLWN